MKRVGSSIIAFLAFFLLTAPQNMHAQNVNINLRPGWNWIGFPGIDTLSMEQSLGGYVPVDGDVIKGRNGFSSYYGGVWFGDMTQMVPGTGYMYYSTNSENTTFTVPLSTTPSIFTNDVFFVTEVGALLSGFVTFEGLSDVTERGLCWSTSPNPTIGGDHLVIGSGQGYFSTLLTSVENNTIYYVRAYATNSTGITYGNEVSFDTFQWGSFENPQSDAEWTLVNGSQANKWCIGTAASNSGSRSLYITNDDGVSNSYTISTTSVAFAYIEVTLEAGVYNYGYSWRCYGESTYDYLRVALVPSTETLTAGSLPSGLNYSSTPSGWLALDGGAKLNMQSSWQYYSGDVTVPSSGSYRMVFVWRNDSSVGTMPPAAVDNVELEKAGGPIVPTVTTGAVTNITQNSASCSGDVTSSGNAQATERGICWSLSHNPTILGSHVSSGAGFGNFTCNITGLTANATYYVRAYASNDVGTSYGNEVSFTTLSPPPGALPGRFTINDSGTQVYFSKGNLQYQASTKTWRFAEHQWDYMGDANSNISSSYNGWIDLFGWATSGYHDSSDPYNVNYQPWSTSTSTVNTTYNYVGYGPSSNMSSQSLTGTSANYDWGVYNRISNGGNAVNQWRTLTGGSWGEWQYLLEYRNTTSGVRYAKATVNGVSGIILVPDDWSVSTYTLKDTNRDLVSYNSNVISQSDWTSVLEPSGCVFLPAGGGRQGTGILSAGNSGNYWSSTNWGNYRAYELYFHSGGIQMDSYAIRYYGYSVRLVRLAQ